MMDNEAKKKYLNQYLEAKRKAALINEQIDKLRDTQTSPMGLGDGMPKGNMKSDLSGYMAKLDKLLSELYAEKEIQMITYHEILQAINAMKDNIEKEILTRRYTLGQSWEKIAVEMGYSYRQILRLHGTSLKNFKF